MNQILVTEKLYVTPELKRKKIIYKISFMMSIFIIIVLCSCYIYAEYDRNKDNGVAQDLLASFSSIEQNNDENNNENNDDIWKIIVASKEQLTDETEDENTSSQEQITQTYTASNGKTYEIVGRITIPTINVEEVILSNTSVELLKIAPCRFYGPENPNEVGNFCIAGHNYRNSRFFSKVPTLVVGDIIEITDLTGRTIKYSVYDKYTVDPTDTDCLDQNTNGDRVVTLITCTDDGEQRVIIHAKEVT